MIASIDRVALIDRIDRADRIYTIDMIARVDTVGASSICLEGTVASSPPPYPV